MIQNANLPIGRARAPRVTAVTLLVLLLATVVSATDITTTTLGNSTWTKAGSPYHVMVNATVSSGATLTMQPGTIVKFDPAMQLQLNGTLNAVGTDADSIVFTSWRDDQYGGDSNGDGSATVPGAGDWNMLYFPNSGSNASVMSHCIVRYGGSGTTGEVRCDAANTLTLQQSRVERSSNYGVWSNSAAPNLYADVFQYNLSYPLLVSGTDGVVFRNPGQPSLPENAFSNNGADAVGVLPTGGNHDISGEWRPVGTPAYPYVLITYGRIHGTTLTIDPGLVVKMAAAAYLDVESSDGATSALMAVGTAADSIVFTALTDDSYGGDTNKDGTQTSPAAGYWDRIMIRGNPASATTLRYCVVRYGGSAGLGSVNPTNEYNDAQPTIRECRIEWSAGPGLRSDGASPKLYDTRLQYNATYPVYSVGYDGITYRNSGEPTLPEDVFTNNGYDAVGIAGSGSAHDVLGAWHKVGSPGYAYVVTMFLRIHGTTLTIDPGLVVKMAAAAYLDVESSDGATSALMAVGTAADSIVFTALTDDSYGGDTNKDGTQTSPAAGYWDRIMIRGNPASATTLRYCVVRYGGSAGLGSVNPTNEYNDAQPTIRECRIEWSAGPGLRSDGASPKLYDTRLQYNATYPVYSVGYDGITYRNSGEPTLPEDVFTNNGYDAVGIAGSGSAHDVLGAWHKVGSPGYAYVVTMFLRIHGTTLTIDPGLVVKMAAAAYLDVESSDGATSALMAVGTAADSIVFTALTDDSYGGDTNKDGTQTSPAAGYWDRIMIRGNPASATTLRYCVVRYGGSAGLGSVNPTNEYNDAQPTIRECRIEWSAGPGLRSDGASPKLYDTRLQYNATYPVYSVGYDGITYRNSGEPTLPEDVFTNNGYDAVGIAGSGSAHDVLGAWHKVGSPGYAYVVTMFLRIHGTTLTIDPGLVVKMAAAAYLDVESSDGATSALMAVGTAADSIVFTALTDDSYGGDTNKDGTQTSPAAGYWDRIMIRGNPASATTLRYCVVRYGGSAGLGSVNPTNEYNDAQPTIRECRIEWSAGPGLRSDGASPKLYDTRLQYNATYPVYSVGYDGITYRNSGEPTLPEDVFTNNGVNAVGIAAGSVSGRWRKPSGGLYPCVVTGGVDVPSGQTLVIDTTTVIKLATNADFIVDGTIQVNGTQASPVIFTSIRDDGQLGDTNGDGGNTLPAAGDWYALHLRNTGSTSSTIVGAVFKYGGGSARGQLWCESTGSGATPNVRIDGCRFIVDLSPGGVYASSSNPRIVNCAFTGPKTRLGVQNATSSITLDATNNWWNDPSGPYDPAGGVGSNPSGLGVGVSDYVLYSPWLFSDPVTPPVAAISPTPFAAAAAVNGSITLPFTIANQGGSDLRYSIAEAAGNEPASVGEERPLRAMPTRDETTDVPWMSESPTTGTVAAHGSANVSVTCNAAGLISARYTAYLLVATNDDTNPQVVIPVIFDVGVPSPPQSITVHGGNIGSSLQVAWNPSPSNNVVGYHIYRSSTTGQIGTLVAALGVTTSWRDDGLDDDGGYYYTVRALSTSGLESTNTTQISATAHDAIVFVHGFTGTHDDWDTFAPYFLGQGFIIYNGLDMTPNVYGPQYLAPQLESYIDGLQEKRVNVVAHSMGGLVAREVVARRYNAHQTSNIGKLVLIATPNHGTEIADAVLPFGSVWRDFFFPGIDTRAFGSKGAIPALATGSAYLNGLNYGGGHGDISGGPSCLTAFNEATYFPQTRYFTIHGTAQECGFYNWALHDVLWKCTNSGQPMPRDGVVSTYSASLHNSQSLGWDDVTLGLPALTHAEFPLPGYFCWPKELESTTLAAKVADILRGNLPPGGLTPEDAAAAQHIADTGPVLSPLPAVLGTLAPQASFNDSLPVASSARFRVVCLASQAGVTLRLQTPGGQLLTPADTSTYSGLAYLADPAGYSGFEVTSPASGLWRIAITGSSNSTTAAFEIDKFVATGRELSIGVAPASVGPNLSVTCTASMSGSGFALAADSLIATLQSEGGSSQVVRLHDDGLNGDATAGDLTYSATVTPAAGPGAYSVTLAAWSGGTAITATAALAVTDLPDLAVPAGGVSFASFPDSIGDTTTVKVRVANLGTAASEPASVEVMDVTDGVDIGTVTLPALAPGQAVTLLLPWTIMPPDTHVVRAIVNPFATAVEGSYTNNTGDGWLHVGVGATAVPTMVPTVSRLLRLWPSPARGAVSFLVDVAPGDRVAVELFDIAGRRLRRLDLAGTAPGRRLLKWDLADANDRTMGPGVYFARLVGGRVGPTQRVVVLR